MDSGFLCVVFSKHYPKIISAYSADPSGPTVLDALSTTTSLAKDPDLRVQFLSELYSYIQSIHRSAFQSISACFVYRDFCNHAKIFYSWQNANKIRVIVKSSKPMTFFLPGTQKKIL